jgi:hypothetical protein
MPGNAKIKDLVGKKRFLHKNYFHEPVPSPPPCLAYSLQKYYTSRPQGGYLVCCRNRHFGIVIGRARHCAMKFTPAMIPAAIGSGAIRPPMMYVGSP